MSNCHYPRRHSDRSIDRRYEIRKEWNGNERQQWVLRFCDDYIAGSYSLESMKARAVEHNTVRLDAPLGGAMTTHTPV